MNYIKYEGKGYQPTYTRTELTDALHEAFGLYTSKEIVPVKKMKKFFNCFWCQTRDFLLMSTTANQNFYYQKILNQSKDPSISVSQRHIGHYR